MTTSDVFKDKWHRARTTTELIKLMNLIGAELEYRFVIATKSLESSELPKISDIDIGHFKKFSHVPGADEEKGWRIVLIPESGGEAPLALEVHQEVVIGRPEEGYELPSIDLHPYEAIRHGVSRRHALLYPSPDCLKLIDLNSTNGTYCGGKRIEAGQPHELKDKEVISFANLHFLFRIIERPEQPE